MMQGQIFLKKVLPPFFLISQGLLFWNLEIILLFKLIHNFIKKYSSTFSKDEPVCMCKKF